MAHIVSPSLLAADFANLQRDIEFVNSSDADWFHIDVMDGVFVPNISFGMPVIKAIAKHANKPLDVHLMIVDPDRYLEDFANLGSNILTVHVEACDHLHRTLAAIRELGMKAGVALNPHTPVESLGEVLNDFDLVCLMGVNPGFGGQIFIERTYEKVRKLREMGVNAGKNFHIEIDGGVTTSNASALVEAGADVLVAGSSIFKAENPGAATTALKNA